MYVLLRQSFIVLSVVLVILGIVKITIAAMFTAWSSDFTGFVFVSYRPEISGAALSGLFDMILSLFGMNAMMRNDILLLYMFTMNMFLVILSKSIHVYLCYDHMINMKYILQNEVILLWEKYSYHNEAINITDHVQSKFKCCGYIEPLIWKRDNLDILPSSCCPQLPCTFKNAYKRGCYSVLLERLKYNWMRLLLCICIPLTEIILALIGCVYAINTES